MSISQNLHLHILLAKLDLLRKLRLPMFGANNDLTVRLLEAGQLQLAGPSQSTPRTGETLARAGCLESWACAGCLESCLPGKKHGCANKSYGKPRRGNNKSCKEVERLLSLLGVNPENVSSCCKAAIMRGHVEMNGEEGELDKVVKQGRAEALPAPYQVNWAEVCGHFVTARLRDLLYQPDYVGLNYLSGDGPDATLECSQCGEGVFLTGLCTGEPTFDCGKYHTHCTKCPGFGSCIGDYRRKHCDSCGEHKFEEFVDSWGESPCDNRKCIVFKKWQADNLKEGLDEMGLSGFLLDEEIKNITGVNPSFSEDSG